MADAPSALLRGLGIRRELPVCRRRQGWARVARLNQAKAESARLRAERAGRWCGNGLQLDRSPAARSLKAPLASG